MTRENYMKSKLQTPNKHVSAAADLVNPANVVVRQT